ncbi:MAG: NAD(P)-dependent oxidoreductase [Bryobacteraceae bacterium]|nr:NAD(P)-dependent oxidoreductase [Bryobacteraceae bacterium]
MPSTFRVGITPDFYVDAKGRFEASVEARLNNVPGLEYAPMPPQPNKTATPEALNEFDAIFAMALNFKAESLKGVERLAVIARWGVGYDMIDVPALTEADVLLAITPNAVRRPVAEAILTLIFALAKNVMEQDRVVRAGHWRPHLSRLGMCLEGRTLGSIGCGNIGGEMFRLASGLGFGRFLAYDPYADAEKAKSLNVELTTLETVLRESDFVAVNCFLNEHTRGLISHAQLRMLKPTAYLINTARGPIVDQKALYLALKERWFAGAGIDVFEVEPLPAGEPIRELDNVILSPHALAWTEEIARDNGLEACDNILAVFRGEVPHGAVNREVLSRPGFQQKLERYRRNK